MLADALVVLPAATALSTNLPRLSRILILPGAEKACLHPQSPTDCSDPLLEQIRPDGFTRPYGPVTCLETAPRGDTDSLISAPRMPRTDIRRRRQIKQKHHKLHGNKEKQHLHQRRRLRHKLWSAAHVSKADTHASKPTAPWTNSTAGSDCWTRPTLSRRRPTLACGAPKTCSSTLAPHWQPRPPAVGNPLHCHNRPSMPSKPISTLSTLPLLRHNRFILPADIPTPHAHR